VDNNEKNRKIPFPVNFNKFILFYINIAISI
jgi:hypothetical protein